MCGIVGAISSRNITPLLLEGLRRLEYRGYDSAGIAVIDAAHHLKRIRIQGKVQALADAMQETSISGTLGIAHTRWATHGKPSEENAHPQLSCGKIAVVHNGIIENHIKLRRKLQDEGYIFTSETDTEVAAHLIHFYYEQHEDLLRAVQDAASELQGAFALGVIHEQQFEQLVAVRKGSPLVIGIGLDERFIASDALALRSFAQSVVYLEEGDSALLSRQEVQVFDAKRRPVTRASHILPLDSHAASKGQYRHFMRKEIDEQPQVLAETLEGRLADLNLLRASLGDTALDLLNQVKCIHIVACGTSYHAGLIAKSWFESLAKLPTHVEIASEYRYRDPVVPPNTLLIGISQSGETADLLAAIQKAKTLGYLGVYAICNVANSSLTRLADVTYLTRAGVEIGVASTKAFTTQLAALLTLAAALCQDERAELVLKELQQLPEACEQVLGCAEQLEALAKYLASKNHALFIGRGSYYPIALEGALKLKEISYIHAEAYPAGELKHGPLALIDKSMPVIALAPHDALQDKMQSNLQEIHARGGQLITLSDGPSHGELPATHAIVLPCSGQWIGPILYTIPLQLLAYYVAVAKGTDVDQPRNLAKSVTVE